MRDPAMPPNQAVSRDRGTAIASRLQSTLSVGRVALLGG
jgi:hypothetical protein